MNFLVSNAPASTQLGFLVYDLQNPIVPGIDLTPLGYTDCIQSVNLGNSTLHLPGAGSWSSQLALPPGVFLDLSVQAATVSPGVNPGGLATSNAIDVEIRAVADANLAWDSNPLTFTPASTTTNFVAGFGLDDFVDDLPPGTTTVTFSDTLTNNGTSPAAGYLVTATVTRWVFVAVGGAVGWTPVGSPFSTTASIPGPTLAPGASAPITIGPVALPMPACGLYQVVLTADSTDVVAESNEVDNVTDRLFFVNSSQWVAVNKTTLNTADLACNPGLPGASFTVVGNTPTAFVSRRGGRGGLGSRTVPLDIPGLTNPATTLPTTTPVYWIRPRATGCNSGFTENFTAKVTAITPDGCMVRQAVARFAVFSR